MSRYMMRSVIAGLLAASSATYLAANDGSTSATDAAVAASPSGTSGNPPGSSSPPPSQPDPQSELRQLRALVNDESQKLIQLQQRLSTMEKEFSGAGSPGEAPAPNASEPLSPAVAMPASTASSAPMGMQGGGRSQQEEPLYFKIGSARFTPGGFLDLAGYYRTTDVGSGIATAFGAIPYNNLLPQGRLGETHFSAQYSRLSLKVDADLTDSTAITGYVETDFLGYQPPNAYQTTNSNSLRMRVYWADVRHRKWEVLAGQEWSLLTPNRVGLSPYTQDIFYTQNEDPNFQVGLIWARQGQVRVTYHPTDHWAVGVSLENPQQFAPASVVFPSPFFTTQFDDGSSATNLPSATTNTAVPNLHPDVIVKTAFDWQPGGHKVHLEAAGLIRSFRVLNDFVTPPATSTATGGGGSINFNVELIKNFQLIANSFYSDGGGRYIFGLGPDAIVKPNGTLSLVHSGSGLGGFEWQATQRYMLYSYYGGAYFARNFGLLPTPGSTCNGVPGFLCVGFGFPGSANTSNRAVQEATIGLIPTLWSNPNYGKLEMITQYSYVVRSPWSVLPLNPKNAHTSMVYIDLRYILP